MAEMVKDGVDGLLFPPGDAVSLAGCLRRLIEDNGLLERLRGGIVPPLSIEVEAETLREMYGAMVSRAPRREQPRPASVRHRAQSVAAVVLNYRTADQTWLAVRSLQTSFTPPARIVVVDNGSNDGSAENLRASLTGVEVMETSRNLGFSGGCNAGIAAALATNADAVLLVNSDVVVAPDAIDYLLDALNSDPKLGIAAPLLLSARNRGGLRRPGSVLRAAPGGCGSGGQGGPLPRSALSLATSRASAGA